MGRSTGHYCPIHPDNAMTALYTRERNRYTHIGYICKTCKKTKIQEGTEMKAYANKNTTDTRNAIEKSGWDSVFKELFPEEEEYNRAILYIWRAAPKHMTWKELDRAIYEMLENVFNQSAAITLEPFGVVPNKP